MDTPNANYDQPWKEAIENYLEYFLEFFFPPVHALIDWTRDYQSLDKELQQISPNATSGEREGDKLFQVWQRNGEDAYILIHIEVQSQEDTDFGERMYIYHYRSFDLHKKVISLAILGDDRPTWRPQNYHYELGGCSVNFVFPIAKLLDYESQWESLERESNPFALLVMAHLKTKATNNKAEERESWKWHLVQLLYERGYTEEDIIKFFRLLDWMMTLPQVLQDSFDTKLQNYQEERKMPILSNIELRAIEKGREAGILENARSSVLEVLTVRFDRVPSELSDRINQITDVATLQNLHRQAISIESLTEFDRLLDND
ncbi:transposase [Baaleninema sp.]|uniref:transposase n=1 Tax=Baaleninema sp. TaxID=3101197 RepID=UPI003D00D20A